MTIEQINNALEWLTKEPYVLVIVPILQERLANITEQICASDENDEKLRGARAELKILLRMNELLVQKRERLRKEATLPTK